MGHGGDLRFQVENLTRVEGEGSLHLRVRDGVVEEAHLAIFEAPRYFEALVVGRTPDEVIDIVARICGICPVAYQMSAVHAFEDLFHVAVDPQVRALRRLLYCAEWIESHALHVYLLHAPDFLGYPSAVELARDHKELVNGGLRLKKAGNHLLSVLGGRPIHPVSVRVGGFSRMPDRAELARPSTEPRGGACPVPGHGRRRDRPGGAGVRARAAAGGPQAPQRVPAQRRPDRLERRGQPPRLGLGQGVPRGPGALVQRPPGAGG